MGAVFDASEATAAGEEGGYESLRQSLIELAAVSEAMADNLPPPLQWMEQNERRAERLAQRQRYRAEAKARAVKRCCRCGDDRPVTEFGRNKASPDGRVYACKVCQGRAAGQTAAANA